MMHAAAVDVYAVSKAQTRRFAEVFLYDLVTEYVQQSLPVRNCLSGALLIMQLVLRTQ